MNNAKTRQLASERREKRHLGTFSRGIDSRYLQTNLVSAHIRIYSKYGSTRSLYTHTYTPKRNMTRVLENITYVYAVSRDTVTIVIQSQVC